MASILLCMNLGWMDTEGSKEGSIYSTLSRVLHSFDTCTCLTQLGMRAVACTVNCANSVECSVKLMLMNLLRSAWGGYNI